MPRSEAFIQADVEDLFRKLGQFREADEPEPVPDEYRVELRPFIAALEQAVRRYRVFKVAAPQERPGRRAKGYGEAIGAAKMLLKALRQMPASQRMPLEPLGPIEDQLETLIARAKKLKAWWTVPPEEARKYAKQQSALARNDLALELKGIAIEHVGKDEHSAETWVTHVLDYLGIKYPNPESRPNDFGKMFGRPAIVDAQPQPSEHGADAELADDELIDMLKGITLGEYDRLTK
jgi:hypothetical protein